MGHAEALRRWEPQIGAMNLKAALGLAAKWHRRHKMRIGINEGCGLGIPLGGERIQVPQMFRVGNAYARLVPFRGHLNGGI